MSEELLSNDPGGKTFDTTVIRTIGLPLLNHMHCRLYYLSLFSMLQPTLCYQQALLRSGRFRDHSKMQNESMKVTWEVKESSRREAQNGQAKNLHKKRPTRLQ